MDDDIEYSDFGSDESFDVEYDASEPPLATFEILTANDIVQLMNQYIEYVNAVIQVREMTISLLPSNKSRNID